MSFKDLTRGQFSRQENSRYRNDNTEYSNESELIICGKCKEYYDLSMSNICPECCKPVTKNIDFALKQVMVQMEEFFTKNDNVWSRK